MSILSHSVGGGILILSSVVFFDGRISSHDYTAPAQAVAAAFVFKRGALSGGQGVDDPPHDFCRGVYHDVNRELSNWRRRGAK